MVRRCAVDNTAQAQYSRLLRNDERHNLLESGDSRRPAKKTFEKRVPY